MAITAALFRVVVNDLGGNECSVAMRVIQMFAGRSVDLHPG
jgi:hypothetical protein